MKNFKKISREQLKQVQGGFVIPVCAPKYRLVCTSVEQCDEGQPNCSCSCVLRTGGGA